MSAFSQSDAVLALADGTVWYGARFGAPGRCAAEIVFNTAMFGYQEILTDPSYCDQIVVFTCPHVGNVGVNALDTESSGVQVAGMVVNRRPTEPSNWVAEASLEDYISRNSTPSICQLDTRALTAHLRRKGVMGACIYTSETNLEQDDVDRAVAMAHTQAPDLSKICLAVRVSTDKIYDLDDTPLAAELSARGSDRPHVVVYDFGVKHSILRSLRDQSCRVSVVPALTPVRQVLQLQPDGVVLSNGPGDPRACPELIAVVDDLIKHPLPVLGICLGYQLLALATGASIFKMKFGHHGANHPVIDLRSGRVFISSQNHNYAVDPASLPPGAEQTHRSLFDQSLQGFRLASNLVFGFQGHPEASPGPRELNDMFADFSAQIRALRTA
ncbi:MAG: glutamine-hydrolyzing carbamoyl-phosphate synthase small subunit [Gammaproteobacteria bacterium]|nr:glutamine-hydrolyzing carbamoyl-phosphate synthase small subunit [Pseudomonadota bacterium]MCH9662929.1 glutamine-hydrolyzing carbamoyl-phosphate synthase small subunit [Gammaproteobacteria bacterium]